MAKLNAIFGTVSVLSIALGAIAPAFAGEGGVAGSATFILNNGQVTQSSVAGAIGKSNATATSGGLSGGGFGIGVNVTSATAFGSAGDLNTNLNVSGNGLNYNANGTRDFNPELNQKSNINGEVNLTAKEGRANY